jgi:transcriptional regulator with XRE-family HTH domain
MNNTRDDKRMTAFGAHLRKLRKAKKWTMKDLAFEADVELSQIHRIEKGKINPTLTTILLLADALKVPAAGLFEFKY